MPNWKTHIEIGKRLNKYLKYEDNEYKAFLFGNILPDINNCYIVSNISKKIPHSITHFKQLTKKTYEEFYNKYKNEIDNKNPLFLGYLFHLYVDYRWNNNFYQKIQKINGVTQDKDELRKLKQSDFRLYNNKFIDNEIELDDLKFVKKECKKISEISIEESDIEKIIKFLENQKEEYKSELTFHSFEELDNLINDTINEIIIFINNTI